MILLQYGKCEGKQVETLLWMHTKFNYVPRQLVKWLIFNIRLFKTLNFGVRRRLKDACSTTRINTLTHHDLGDNARKQELLACWTSSSFRKQCIDWDIDCSCYYKFCACPVIKAAGPLHDAFFGTTLYSTTPVIIEVYIASSAMQDVNDALKCGWLFIAESAVRCWGTVSAMMLCIIKQEDEGCV